jgi:hypothetical protein
MQRRPADAIINDLFIPDSFPGGYLRVVLIGTEADPGIIHIPDPDFGKPMMKKQMKNESFGVMPVSRMPVRSRSVDFGLSVLS